MGRDKKPELSSKPEKKDPKNDGVKITPSPKQASTSGTVNPAINHHNRAESVKTTGNSDVKIVGDQNMKDVVRELIDRNIALEVRSLAQQVAANNLTSRNYDSDDEDMSCGHWCEYVIVVVLSSILLVASLVLVLFWCLYYRKGYAWNDNLAQQFNLHPTLMITGFVFFSGFSMLLYRISRCCRRIYVKLLHTLFHTLAIPCVVLGFMAVLDFHNLADPPIPNFYSIHSWMGFVTMGLFALQFVVGFFSFLLLLCCDSATAGFRASLVPVHATFGLTTFMLAIATCLTGLTQKANSSLGSVYQESPEEGIIMNALAMVLVALAILVSYAVRREPLRVHSISYVSERL
uniref:Cytochrome b reductase 1 n=1 Tax=Lygus hesperus TaxID=30085 RepID=A0A146KMU1_LYGHE